MRSIICDGYFNNIYCIEIIYYEHSLHFHDVFVANDQYIA